MVEWLGCFVDEPDPGVFGNGALADDVEEFFFAEVVAA